MSVWKYYSRSIVLFHIEDDVYRLCKCFVISLTDVQFKYNSSRSRYYKTTYPNQGSMEDLKLCRALRERRGNSDREVLLRRSG